MPEPTADRADSPPRRTLTLSPAVRFAGAAVAAFAAGMATYALFVLTEPGQRLENLALAGAALRDPAARQLSLTQLSLISVLAFFLAILAIVAVAFARRRPGFGLAVGFGMGIAVAASQVLQEVVPRLELVTGPAWLLRNDFPSGHATIAAAVGLGILLVAPERLRWLLLPIGAGYAALIGQATQVAGWHRLSAGLGGVLLAVAVMFGVLAMVAARGLVSRSIAGRIDPRLRRLLWLVPSIAFATVMVVVGLLILFPLLRTPVGADSVFVHTSLEVLGIGLTVLVFLVFGGLIEPFSLGRTPPADRPAPAVEPAVAVPEPD